MKRNVTGKLAMMLVISSLCFGGCGIRGTVQKDISNSETSKTTENTAQMDSDVYRMLEDAAQEASLLQKKLTEDESLTQKDMNDLSYEIYMIWDELLNEFWGVLKDSLDQESMDTLLQEQRAWITKKEAEVKQASEKYAGGSMEAFEANQKAAELTRARVYALAEYFQ